MFFKVFVYIEFVIVLFFKVSVLVELKFYVRDIIRGYRYREVGKVTLLVFYGGGLKREVRYKKY